MKLMTFPIVIRKSNNASFVSLPLKVKKSGTFEWNRPRCQLTRSKFRFRGTGNGTSSFFRNNNSFSFKVRDTNNFISKKWVCFRFIRPWMKIILVHNLNAYDFWGHSILKNVSTERSNTRYFDVRSYSYKISFFIIIHVFWICFDKWEKVLCQLPKYRYANQEKKMPFAFGLCNRTGFFSHRSELDRKIYRSFLLPKVDFGSRTTVLILLS